jgi:hypothetical protein
VPRKQCRVLSQQSLQAFDVVVVNDAPSLRCRPLEPLAEPFADFSGQVLPSGIAVLASDDKLRVALRQRQVGMWQVDARTRDGSGVTGGDVARELLCLLAEGFERPSKRATFRTPFQATCT